MISFRATISMSPFAAFLRALNQWMTIQWFHCQLRHQLEIRYPKFQSLLFCRIIHNAPLASMLWLHRWITYIMGSSVKVVFRMNFSVLHYFLTLSYKINTNCHESSVTIGRVLCDIWVQGLVTLTRAPHKPTYDPGRITNCESVDICRKCVHVRLVLWLDAHY